jgi:hypothetical protein
MNMTAAQARVLLFQRKLALLPVDFSIPGVPKLDNQLSVIELGEDALRDCNKLAEQKDGSTDPALAQCAAICRSLVLTDTKERLCSDNDVESVLAWGHSVLGPLSELVTQVSALTADSLAYAKKNSPIIPVNVSATLSPESLVEETPSQS